MVYMIISSTDHKFIGNNIDYDGVQTSITLPNGSNMQFYKKIILNEDNIRLSNSNYCIDIKKIQ